ncbi:ComEC family competence protein [Cyanobacterium stanieri LEGE 03274]|uniref:ComEC family competence protein n=1 Tax=Cyanobacterium stanieri LEGE 03274 TaxID=1828756 RepID=A0ABR9V4R3_9CHRO|nr:ComEC/Rec2 family competence protein [Cyanobacterium stanieri]MBE9222878.1 ComEC family competence protein [Cyanobacterium stanieri LEGE 03274]
MPNRDSYKIYLLIISYILGLLLTGLSIIKGNEIFLVLIIIIISLILAFTIPLKWYFAPKKPWWLIAGLVIISSYYYYQWKLPKPSPIDISHQLTTIEDSFDNSLQIKGKIITPLQVNRNQRARFILEAKEFEGKKVNGKLYVTAPLLETINLFPSMEVTLTGRLYQPPVANQPGGFDFASFLSRQGIWAGFSAQGVELNKFGNIYQQSVYELRKRVIQSHVRYLNIPYGTLVSAMVIGSRGVDLSFEIQDSFRDAGLAHILAASGFHVSILLGFVLWLSARFSSGWRLGCGMVSLLFYLTLTGFYPSVLRASFMGLAVLVALWDDSRRVNVVASLWLTALILLLINPLWIWDLGFQLSFLATFGLIMTFQPIVSRLDFLPTTIARLVAVPLAATIWIIPLQGYIFHRLPVYSILTNIVVSPLALILTLGGIISGFIGLFLPMVASAIALMLYPFIRLMIEIVKISNNLPFSSLAMGNISLTVISITYAIYIGICFHPTLQKRWRELSLFIICLIIIPIIYQKINLTQVTIIRNNPQPIIIIENNLHNYLINLPDKNNLNYTLTNFLNHQGINNIDLILAKPNLENNLSLNYLNQKTNIKNIYQNQKNPLNLHPLSHDLDIITWEIEDKKWMFINTEKTINLDTASIGNIDTLIWSGNNLSISDIEKINPSTIINYNNFNQEKLLKSPKINIYSLPQENAIQWQPNKGFLPYQESIY